MSSFTGSSGSSTTTMGGILSALKLVEANGEEKTVDGGPGVRAESNRVEGNVFIKLGEGAILTLKPGTWYGVVGVEGPAEGNAKFTEVAVGVPGREIGTLRLRGGGAIGESIANGFRDTPVSIDKELLVAGLLEGEKGLDGEAATGVAKTWRFGSTILWSKESVRRGGKLALDADDVDDDGVAVKEALIAVGSKAGAAGLRGALCEDAKGGGRGV